MEHTYHHHPRHGSHAPEKKKDLFRLSVAATLHCLLGCGLGEVAGMALAAWLGLAMVPSMALAVLLGFIFGLGLGVLPLVRKKFSVSKALKIVIVAEGLSIVVMETFEVLTQVLIPGVMEAGLDDGIFWLGMGAALLAGFLAALPVNYIMIRRGVRHSH
jgi:hypothetical protein